MRWLISFFSNVFAFFQIVGLEIYDDILVKEYGWKSRHDRPYFIGEKKVQKLLKKELCDLIKNNGFKLIIDQNSEFRVQSTALTFHFIYKESERVQLEIKNHEFNVTVNPYLWASMLFQKQFYNKKYTHMSHQNVVINQLKLYCCFINQNFDKLLSSDLIHKYQASKEKLSTTIDRDSRLHWWDM